MKRVGILMLIALSLSATDYLAYKNTLIKKYGESTYKLMNIEAGIDNEIESYTHYIINGK